MKPSEEPSAGSAEKKKTVGEMEEESRQAMEELFPSEPPKEDEGEWKIIEEKLSSLGERMEEAMVVAGVELTPYSTLKKLRTACELLKIGKTGSKAQVWQRLKAVSANKMKELVEISKGLEVEFSREPKGEKRPEEPTEEERRKHELTHLPKADWLERVAKRQGQERTTLKFPRRRTKHRWFRWILSLLEQEMKRTQRTTKMH